MQVDKTVDIFDHFEVIEGLLQLCSHREKQIQALIDENEALKLQIDKIKRRTKKAGAGKPDQPVSTVPGTTKVLVIDSSDAKRGQLGSLFRANGYLVVGEIKDGSLVEQFMRTHLPELVTIDIDVSETTRQRELPLHEILRET